MRLIDADALHEKMCERMTRFHALGQARVAQDYNFVATVVGNTPTVDAVPVVRCRECENWKPYGSKAARKLGDPLERYGMVFNALKEAEKKRIAEKKKGRKS